MLWFATITLKEYYRQTKTKKNNACTLGKPSAWKTLGKSKNRGPGKALKSAIILYHYILLFVKL